MELESLIKEGDAISIDDAIRDAVREYTRERARMRLE
jgi:Arc/MetJ-type ribon-helix-helix transcriptional regulator